MAGIWGQGETALPGDPRRSSRSLRACRDGGRIRGLNGLASAFTPEYAPEETCEIAQKLYAASR